MIRFKSVAIRVVKRGNSTAERESGSVFWETAHMVKFDHSLIDLQTLKIYFTANFEFKLINQNIQNN